MAGEAMRKSRLALAAFVALATAGLAAHVATGADMARPTGLAALENTPAPSAPDPALATVRADAQTPVGAQKAALRGNPLWAIPLRALAATRDRPLFSASRRPPAAVVAAAPAPVPAAPMPVVAKPAEAERPPMTLIGTIVGASDRIAIIVDDATRSAKRLREGDEESGWRVRTVLARSAIVEKSDQSVTLALPKPSDEPSPPGEMPAEAPPPPVNDSAL
jgi:general secretion pathway protein N